jgi:hypothetical protein
MDPIIASTQFAWRGSTCARSGSANRPHRWRKAAAIGISDHMKTAVPMSAGPTEADPQEQLVRAVAQKFHPHIGPRGAVGCRKKLGLPIEAMLGQEHITRGFVLGKRPFFQLCGQGLGIDGYVLVPAADRRWGKCCGYIARQAMGKYLDDFRERNAQVALQCCRRANQIVGHVQVELLIGLAPPLVGCLRSLTGWTLIGEQFI